MIARIHSRFDPQSLHYTRSCSPLTARLPRTPRSPSPLARDNPFRFHTSAKDTCNPFRFRTSKTQNLKSFRIRTYKNPGRGEDLSPLTIPCPTSSHLCLCLLFLLSSPPQGENTHVSE